MFECNPNTLDLCEKNIIPYQDRITLIKGTSCNYDGNIDICYINDNDYKFIENKIPLNRVKLLLNNEKVLFNYFKKQVILVSTGVFQTYIKENINQLLKFDFDIHVIVDSPFLKNLEEYSSSIKIIDTSSILTNFDEKSKLDKHFRDEFWNNASKRLFLVYEYMRRKNIKNVIHLENPSSGAEDFAELLKDVPGSMFRLGVAGPEGCAPLHNGQFCPHEDSIEVGINVIISTLIRWMKNYENVA